jgi:adenylyltransferase/sulfurtransferase
MSTFSLPDPASGFELSVKDVDALNSAIAEGSLRLIDCREQDEWDFNHLPCAKFFPLSRFMEAGGVLVKEQRPTIIYCHHGIRSMQATSWLRSRGLDKCWSMKGGIDAWSKQIDPEMPRY